MRFFDSPYESLVYKYLREVDRDAVQEDAEDPFMQVASKKGDQHEKDLFDNLASQKISSKMILEGEPEDMMEAMAANVEQRAAEFSELPKISENTIGRESFP